ncbi:hypothetical protein D3C72_1894390 [compost metagenome]
MRSGGGGLVGGSQGDAPGTFLQLPRKQLGRHGGLAMGRQLHAIFTHEAAHPREVVRKTFLIEHSGRQAEVLGQQVPAHLARIFRGQRRVHPAQRLVQRIDDPGLVFPLILCLTHAVIAPQKF